MRFSFQNQNEIQLSNCVKPREENLSSSTIAVIFIPGSHCRVAMLNFSTSNDTSFLAFGLIKRPALGNSSTDIEYGYVISTLG